MQNPQQFQGQPRSNPKPEYEIPDSRDVNVVGRIKRRFSNSYESCASKIKIYKRCRYIAWVLFGLNLYLAYIGVSLYSGSRIFGLLTAGAVGTLQWMCSEAILTRSLGYLFILDRDGNGEVSIDEWVRWGITMGGLITAYGLNVLTNLLAVDRGALGAIPFEITNLEANGLVTNIVAFVICTILVFSDEMIRQIADYRIAQLQEELPALRRNDAIRLASDLASTEFANELIIRAMEKGRENGQNYPI